MANSSDWIAQASESSRAQPGWITALRSHKAFLPVSPFSDAAPAQSPQPEHNPVEQPVDSTEDLVAEAFSKGEAAGRTQAQAEAETELAAQRALRAAFRMLDKAALDALAVELSETVLALCTQVIDERAIDRDKLVDRCHAAARRIGEAPSKCTLMLHPDDLERIDGAELEGMQVRPDPSLERGALTLEGPDGAISDGPSAWRRAIAEALRT